jgi:uncharacterized membrane protein
MRWLLWILGGIILGGLAHLGMILYLPYLATNDPYARLAPVAPVNTIAPIPAPSAAQALLPFMDPAVATAVCRYDLAAGPMQLSVNVSPDYTSVSFYTRYGIAYYAINDRAAGRRVIELSLMTEQQHADMPEEEDVTSADRLIVESPTETGLIILKALAPEPALMTAAQESLQSAQCRPLPQQ